MNYDRHKVDEAVLALMYLTLHQGSGGVRAWKGFDWESLNRLHEQDMIADPRSKARSVLLTDTGLKACERLFARYFGVAV
jgi:hypothetical protein